MSDKDQTQVSTATDAGDAGYNTDEAAASLQGEETLVAGD